jgi:hypothetical protein
MKSKKHLTRFVESLIDCKCVYVNRLRSIKAEIKADDKVFSERRKKKEEKKARDLSRTKTLSKNKYPL